MKTQPYDWTFRRVVWATLVLVLVAFAFWLFYRFYQVVFILFIAIFIGTVIRPVVTWLNRRGLPRTAGVILVYFLLLILIVGFALLFFPLIAEQSGKIITSLPGYYQSLREWMLNSPNQLILRLSEFLPVTLPATIPGMESIQQTGPQILSSADQALGYVASAANILFMFTALLLLVFHWTLDGPRIIQTLMLMVPSDQRESISGLILAMETKLGFYIAGQGVLCLTIGIMALISFMLIGLPNALVLALIVGVLEAVPMIGPLLGAIPAGIIALTISPTKLVWVIVATVITQQVENSFLVPRVMSKAVGVNPFVSIMSILAFSSLFGIAGTLMAIPIAAIIQLLLDHFVFNIKAIEPEVSDGRDHASRLRYEAQGLVQNLRKQARIKKGGSDLRVKQIDQMMDEIESITTDLDALLEKTQPSGEA
jgi:predicted PurR-regulated permease PerM